jgi:hypothetical protein
MNIFLRVRHDCGILTDSTNIPASARADVDHIAAGASSSTAGRGSRSRGRRRLVGSRRRGRGGVRRRRGSRAVLGLVVGLAALVVLSIRLATHLGVRDMEAGMDGGDTRVGGLAEVGGEGRGGDEGEDGEGCGGLHGEGVLGK